MNHLLQSFEVKLMFSINFINGRITIMIGTRYGRSRTREWCRCRLVSEIEAFGNIVQLCCRSSRFCGGGNIAVLRINENNTSFTVTSMDITLSNNMMIIVVVVMVVVVMVVMVMIMPPHVVMFVSKHVVDERMGKLCVYIYICLYLRILYCLKIG